MKMLLFILAGQIGLLMWYWIMERQGHSMDYANAPFNAIAAQIVSIVQILLFAGISTLF